MTELETIPSISLQNLDTSEEERQKLRFSLGGLRLISLRSCFLNDIIQALLTKEDKSWLPLFN